MSRDTDERQKAFTGLLGHPVVDRRRHPELFALVRNPRHRRVLVDWFSERLGYRLVVSDAAARLFRLPLENETTAPRRYEPPSRRALVLAVLAAAAAEDTEDITTTQDLSDRVRALSRHEDVDVAPYDPDRFAERPQDRSAPEAATRFRLMRRLLELPVCLLDDLSEAERTYLNGQRYRILAWCEEMTGWVAEQRAEGLALIADGEEQTDLPFPRVKAVDFAALMVLDELRRRQDVRGTVDDEEVDRAVAQVRARHPKAKTKELATDLAVRDHSLELLRALDLVRPAAVPGRWWVSPVAARFRDPRVVAVSSTLDGGNE